MNDDSFLKRVLDKALVRIPVDVLNVLSAAEQSNFENLARGAHALAGMSANLEAQQLLAAARGLEDLARRQESSALPALLVELRQAATHTEAAIVQLRDQLASASGVA